jgi:hypothetical protein
LQALITEAQRHSTSTRYGIPRARATAFHERFFGCAEIALAPLPARATATSQHFFAFGKTVLPSLPALFGSFRIV